METKLFPGNMLQGRVEDNFITALVGWSMKTRGNHFIFWLTMGIRGIQCRVLTDVCHSMQLLAENLQPVKHITLDEHVMKVYGPQEKLIH